MYPRRRIRPAFFPRVSSTVVASQAQTTISLNTFLLSDLFFFSLRRSDISACTLIRSVALLVKRHFVSMFSPRCRLSNGVKAHAGVAFSLPRSRILRRRSRFSSVRSLTYIVVTYMYPRCRSPDSVGQLAAHPPSDIQRNNSQTEKKRRSTAGSDRYK